MAMHLAHRGLIKKKLSENTIISFKESVKKWYGIETDIHFTSITFTMYTFITPPGIVSHYGSLVSEK